MTKADFELILRKQQAMVYSIAYHFFHNAALAEEVAQDVFLQLYERRNTVASSAHAESWLRRTVTHRCIDAMRHKGMRSELQFDELPDISDDYREADPLLQERLRRLVASLPEKLRAVVILRYGEDMDVEEISKTLDVPVRTVWSNLQRAVGMMREKASRYLKEVSNEPTR
jgi:RNA polymerase sigma-70 factor (ECF subfamily)